MFAPTAGRGSLGSSPTDRACPVLDTGSTRMGAATLPSALLKSALMADEYISEGTGSSKCFGQSSQMGTCNTGQPVTLICL